MSYFELQQLITASVEQDEFLISRDCDWLDATVLAIVWIFPVY